MNYFLVILMSRVSHSSKKCAPFTSGSFTFASKIFFVRASWKWGFFTIFITSSILIETLHGKINSVVNVEQVKLAAVVARVWPINRTEIYFSSVRKFLPLWKNIFRGVWLKRAITMIYARRARWNMHVTKVN